MNNSFSPKNHFQRSPMGFQNRFRMQQNQQQYNQNTQQGMQFRSPLSSPNFHQRMNCPSPDFRQQSTFELRSPNNGNFSSPQFHSSPRTYTPRNRSPFVYKRNSFSGSWNNQSNLSLDSSANSSAYLADVSGSPYSTSNEEQRLKKKRFSQGDSNPGHSASIEDYLHPSMLEDPWEKDMIEYERKRKFLDQEEEKETS